MYIYGTIIECLTKSLVVVCCIAEPIDSEDGGEGREGGMSGWLFSMLVELLWSVWVAVDPEDGGDGRRCGVSGWLFSMLAELLWSVRLGAKVWYASFGVPWVWLRNGVTGSLSFGLSLAWRFFLQAGMLLFLSSSCWILGIPNEILILLLCLSLFFGEIETTCEFFVSFGLALLWSVARTSEADRRYITKRTRSERVMAYMLMMT